jgi:hypothetical protein
VGSQKWENQTAIAQANTRKGHQSSKIKYVPIILHDGILYIKLDQEREEGEGGRGKREREEEGGRGREGGERRGRRGQGKGELH